MELATLEIIRDTIILGSLGGLAIKAGVDVRSFFRKTAREVEYGKKLDIIIKNANQQIDDRPKRWTINIDTLQNRPPSQQKRTRPCVLACGSGS